MTEVQIVQVTPAVARAWLANNDRNRHLSPGLVRRYGDAMRRGEWTMNGSTIVIGQDGTLLDGQHRLRALADSGCTVPMMVVYGVAREAQDVIDTGRKRTTGDQLAIKGVQSAQAVAASVRLVMMYEAGTMGDTYKAPSTPMILDYVTAHPEVEESQRIGRQAARSCGGMRPAVGSAAFQILRGIDAESTRLFFEGVIEGAMLPAKSPILALRARMRTVKDERIQLSDAQQLSLVLRAWNAWGAGQAMTVMPLYNGKGEFIELPPIKLPGSKRGTIPSKPTPQDESLMEVDS